MRLESLPAAFLLSVLIGTPEAQSHGKVVCSSGSRVHVVSAGHAIIRGMPPFQSA